MNDTITRQQMENNLRMYLKENDLTTLDALIRMCSCFEILNSIILTEIGQLEQKHLKNILMNSDDDTLAEVILLLAGGRNISRSMR